MSENDGLRTNVEQLAARVHTLEDQVEIMQLVAQYGPAVDSGSGAAGHQSLIHNGCGHVLTVPHVVVDGDQATGRSYALNIRWDANADRFWVARVSANTWHWVRTSEGWRITDRVNANLDGTAEHRDMLAPPAE